MLLCIEQWSATRVNGQVMVSELLVGGEWWCFQTQAADGRLRAECRACPPARPPAWAPPSRVGGIDGLSVAPDASHPRLSGLASSSALNLCLSTPRRCAPSRLTLIRTSRRTLRTILFLFLLGSLLTSACIVPSPRRHFRSLKHTSPGPGLLLFTVSPQPLYHRGRTRGPSFGSFREPFHKSTSHGSMILHTQLHT